ncbi:hypothetical protein LSH36_406g00027 [Paralvinella palmiformis]|uniref:Uncharacterized protein n=1 Tax=Paralvinella palmiformis TaxID=53620 RepID=A0AAD9N150_9ANNE|nr:hypothetical protein LSH36_406g00027 [Paralvinella palmiformis]
MASVGSRMSESCGCCVACYFLGGLRTKFRDNGNIQGSVCNDGYLSMLCVPCVVWQIERELNNLGI